jgi:hypothetical protein
MVASPLLFPTADESATINGVIWGTPKACVRFWSGHGALSDEVAIFLDCVGKFNR